MLGLAAGRQVQCLEETIERVGPARPGIHGGLRTIRIRGCVGIRGLGPWFGIRHLGPWLGSYEGHLPALGIVPAPTDNGFL